MILNIRKSGEIKIRKKKFRAAFERFFAFRFLTLSWSEWAENEQWTALNKLHAVLRLISGVGVLFVESLLRRAFFKNIIVFQLVLSLICATIHINLSPASLISRHFDSPFDASDYVRLHSTLSKFMMFSVFLRKLFSLSISNSLIYHVTKAFCFLLQTTSCLEFVNKCNESSELRAVDTMSWISASCRLAEQQ